MTMKTTTATTETCTDMNMRRWMKRYQNMAVSGIVQSRYNLGKGRGVTPN
jgi:hypothetical protein